VGGSPEDFFPSDLSNVVIGDPQGHSELFRTIRKYGIIVLDDAGVSLNSRRFMSEYNVSMANVIQTMRPARNILLISTPDSMTVDILVRTLVSHYAEVAESFHGHGFNLVKVFQVHRKYREGKTHYVYYQSGTQQIVRYKFPNPPDAIIDTYELKRYEAAKAIASRAGKEKEKIPREVFPTKICRHCNYSWTPVTVNPLKCPKCSARNPCPTTPTDAKPLIS
jgi:rubrerythrin